MTSRRSTTCPTQSYVTSNILGDYAAKTPTREGAQSDKAKRPIHEISGAAETYVFDSHSDELSISLRKSANDSSTLSPRRLAISKRSGIFGLVAPATRTIVCPSESLTSSQNSSSLSVSVLSITTVHLPPKLAANWSLVAVGCQSTRPFSVAVHKLSTI